MTMNGQFSDKFSPKRVSVPGCKHAFNTVKGGSQMGITGPAAAASRVNVNLILYQAANQTCKLTCIDI